MKASVGIFLVASFMTGAVKAEVTHLKCTMSDFGEVYAIAVDEANKKVEFSSLDAESDTRIVPASFAPSSVVFILAAGNSFAMHFKVDRRTLNISRALPKIDDKVSYGECEIVEASKVRKF